MTPNKILDIGLRRAGLTASSSEFKDNGREYFNLAAKDITGRVQWSWMFQDASITTSSGTRTYSLASDVLEPLSFSRIRKLRWACSKALRPLPPLA